MTELRTVVYAPNWVGDTLMALPAIEALATSGRRVDVVARGHLRPLLDLSPAIAASVEAADDATTLGALRAGRYDEAVLLPNSFRCAWLTRRAGIPHRWGYAGGFRRFLMSPAVARSPATRHQVEDYAALLAAMGVAAPPDWTPRLKLSQARRGRGAELLRRVGIDPEGGPIVGFFPGAEFGASKQWPRGQFAEAARLLRRRRHDVQLTLLAGPKEVELAVRLREETDTIHPVVGPDLDLGDLASVLSHHRTLLTNDSGPMHLGAAVGARCVALFGPTDPVRTAPAGDGHRVLTLDRWCSPCFRRNCPLAHHKCMTEIAVEHAVSAVEAMLAQSRSNNGSPPSTA